VSRGYFFYNGRDCNYYILLHMLGLVNKDSFSKIDFIIYMVQFVLMQKNNIPRAMDF
jgi:hypothetical protein